MTQQRSDAPVDPRFLPDPVLWEVLKKENLWDDALAVARARFKEEQEQANTARWLTLQHAKLDHEYRTGQLFLIGAISFAAAATAGIVYCKKPEWAAGILTSAGATALLAGIVKTTTAYLAASKAARAVTKDD